MQHIDNDDADVFQITHCKIYMMEFVAYLKWRKALRANSKYLFIFEGFGKEEHSLNVSYFPQQNAQKTLSLLIKAVIHQD